MLLLRSGNFAGGIFQGNQLVEHKTMKRYTVRERERKGDAAFFTRCLC